MAVVISPSWYLNSDSIGRFLESALDRIHQIADVAAAGMISSIPYDDWGSNVMVRYEGQPSVDGAPLPAVEARVVTPSFFRVSGQRLLSGRWLEPSDDERPQAPAVAVVNDRLVQRDFAAVDPVERRILLRTARRRRLSAWSVTSAISARSNPRGRSCAGPPASACAAPRRFRS